EPDDGVDARAHGDVRQPQRVEAERLELLDQLDEARRIEGETTRRHGETHLHDADVRCREQTGGLAVRLGPPLVTRWRATEGRIPWASSIHRSRHGGCGSGWRR